MPWLTNCTQKTLKLITTNFICELLIEKDDQLHSSTVQFNYNFIFTHVYMHGTTRKLHCIPIMCLRGPRFLLACNYRVLCNMRVSCNLSWKHVWNKTRMHILNSPSIETTTDVSNTLSPLENSGKLSCKQHFDSAHIKSFMNNYSGVYFCVGQVIVSKKYVHAAQKMYGKQLCTQIRSYLKQNI